MSQDNGRVGEGRALSEREAAKRLEISPITLRHWRYRGIAPPHSKVGRRALYFEGWLESWIRLGGHQAKGAKR